METYARAGRLIGGGNIIIREESGAGLRLSAAHEVTGSGGFKAFPARLEGEELWLEIPAMEGMEKLQLVIYDMQGRVMAS